MTWETVPFSAAFLDITAKSPRVKRSEFAASGKFPVRDQGEQDVAGYWDDVSAVTRVDRPLILFGDHTRRVKFASEDFVIGADGVKVLATSPGLEPRFAFHWMSALKIPSAGYSRHFKFLQQHHIPLPPLPEQRRIAAILDEADALRAVQSRTGIAIQELAEAAFRTLESSDPGRRVSLSEIADVSSGITKGRPAPSGSLVKVPYMTVANVQDKRLDLSTVKEIEASTAEVERYRLRSGDLLLTEGGDPDKLGRGAVWHDAIPLTIHQNHVFRVRLKTGPHDPLWLNWEIGSAYGKRYFLRAAKQTTGIASINSTQLKAFPLRIPHESAVRSFLDALASAQALEHVERARTDNLDTLFASLQHRAFRGEL